MDKLLSGNRVFVTGGAGAIGRQLSVGLARSGAQVVIVDFGDATAALYLVRAEGREALVLHCDLADADAVAAMTQEVERVVGGCDILLRVAADQPHDEIAAIDLAAWQRTQRINADSLLIVAQRFVPGVYARNWGRIIRFTSMQVYEGTPLHAQHQTSKAALIGLTRLPARDFGRYNVTANTIAPGLEAGAESLRCALLMIVLAASAWATWHLSRLIVLSRTVLAVATVS